MKTILSYAFSEGGIRSAVLVNAQYQVKFDPDKWALAGKNGLVDCYAYALNLPEIGANGLGCLFAHENGGAECRSVEDLKALLQRDELQEFEILPQDGSHIIAVFYGSSTHGGQMPVHCYRRDEDGWSHLHNDGDCRSGGKPEQTDFSGSKIDDPQQCNRGNYTKFAGYWAIPYEGILVRPKMSCFQP